MKLADLSGSFGSGAAWPTRIYPRLRALARHLTLADAEVIGRNVAERGQRTVDPLPDPGGSLLHVGINARSGRGNLDRTSPICMTSVQTVLGFRHV
ncbi:MAG TPA: hypothetical protein VFZ10_04965, partial [Geminicoccaceae bacterium]